MKTLRALIVDDEAPARRKLVRMLGDAGGIEIAGEAGDGAAALAALASARPELVFLDVDMPGLNGIAVAEAAPPGTQIIFVTAHARFAPRAFELRACDYILKPYDPGRLQAVLEHARERIAATPPRLEVDLGNRTIFLDLGTLDWAQAARNYVELHMAAAWRSPERQRADPAGNRSPHSKRPTGATRAKSGEPPQGKTLLTRTTFEAFAARLDQDAFVRISRSVLVRRDAIVETRSSGHGECRVILHDGSQHTWTRRFRSKPSG